jgi:hypothetical protein
MYRIGRRRDKASEKSCGPFIAAARNTQGSMRKIRTTTAETISAPILIVLWLLLLVILFLWRDRLMFPSAPSLILSAQTKPSVLVHYFSILVVHLWRINGNSFILTGFPAYSLFKSIIPMRCRQFAESIP